MRRILSAAAFAAVLLAAFATWSLLGPGPEAPSEATAPAAPTAPEPMVTAPSGPRRAPAPADAEPLPVLPAETREALEAFFALTALDPKVEEGMSREAEDDLHVKALMEKASRIADLVALLDRDAATPALRRQALLAKARVHVDMADFLAGAPVPAHLSPEQATHYADGIAAKAAHQFDLAHEVLDGLEAEDPGAGEAIASLRKAIDAR